MRKVAKKRVGRPPGRKAPHRPVLSARMPQELYERVKTEAQAGGRTAGEELVLRASQHYEWQQRFGEARAVLAEAQRIKASNLRTAASEGGWQRVRGTSGIAWFEPGVDPNRWIADAASSQPVFEELLERALSRAVKAVLAEMEQTKSPEGGQAS